MKKVIERQGKQYRIVGVEQSMSAGGDSDRMYEEGEINETPEGCFTCIECGAEIYEEGEINETPEGGLFYLDRKGGVLHVYDVEEIR